MRHVLWPILTVCFFSGVLAAGEDAIPPAAQKPPTLDKVVERVCASCRNSVVVIRVAGRDGRHQGLGTGFVVAGDGLIATNLHVIGEGRLISVQLADGSRHPVISIHASDRSLDLALIRIDAKNMVPLPLGDSDGLQQGQPIVALGNPHGLEHSVVSGVVSGKRDVDGRPMIQLAIPLEPGNSGGPLVDLQGRVQGILTLKSQLSPNLGFAMAVNSLRALIKKPNPIPMSRWLNLGALDPGEWQPLWEASWRRRGGKILVEGQGSGFGGRALCLSQLPIPALPYELAVTVRLDDESGAAGLVFYADGKDKHYGFYPSGGQLRLTRFDGPDVSSWNILRQAPSPHYRPGEWNTLKVRLEKEKLTCYVNGHIFYELKEPGPHAGKAGLAKFRDTHAEFKNFQLAREIAPAAGSAAVTALIAKSAETLASGKAAPPALLDSLLPAGPPGVAALREQAKTLEERAARLRRLAQAVHQKRVQEDIVALLRAKENEIDLLQGALLIAKLDNEELDDSLYRKDVERMVAELSGRLPKDANEQTKLTGLNKYLFTERGFHGSRSDYYNKSNSYLSEVIDDREGLPITLSVLYMDVARRLGLNVVGVGLPGHFVVRHIPASGQPQLLDVFAEAQPVSLEEAGRRIEAVTGRPLENKDLDPTSKRAILVRMLHNLLGIARNERDGDGMLRYLDTILAIAPESGPERWTRALLRLQNADQAGAKEDTDWLIEHHPEGVEIDRVRELRAILEGNAR